MFPRVHPEETALKLVDKEPAAIKVSKRIEKRRWHLLVRFASQVDRDISRACLSPEVSSLAQGKKRTMQTFLRAG